MNFKLVITSLVIVILLVIIFYWFYPVEVELEEVTQLYTEKELPGTWWSRVIDDKHSVQRKYNIELPENDYDQNYLVVSGGREIDKLTYMRISKFLTPYFEKPYIGNASFGDELNSHTIYVYKIDKINIIDSEAAGW